MTENYYLQVNDLNKNFGGISALSGINIEINNNDFIGLIGPNGSGKTTLINLISGIYQASKGNICFDGENITYYNSIKMHQLGICRTFQNTRLVDDINLIENIQLGIISSIKKKLTSQFFRGRLLDEKIKYNKKTDELVNIFLPHIKNLDVEVSSLSNIDKKRIEICRAMIGKPKLLLLDEPSAGMTIDEGETLIKEINNYKKLNPMTIILVEHEMHLIKKFTNRTIVLNYGKKIADGSFEVVSKNEAVIEAYLGNS